MKKRICLWLVLVMLLLTLPACRKETPEFIDSEFESTVYVTKDGYYTHLYLPLFRLCFGEDIYSETLSVQNCFVFGEDAFFIGENTELLDGGTVEVFPTRLAEVWDESLEEGLSASEKRELENAVVLAFALRFDWTIGETVAVTGFEIPSAGIVYRFGGLTIVPEALPEGYAEGDTELLLGSVVTEQYLDEPALTPYSGFVDVHAAVDFSAIRVRCVTPGWTGETANVGPLQKSEWAEWDFSYEPTASAPACDTVLLTMVIEMERPSGEKVRCYGYAVSAQTPAAFAKAKLQER